MLVTGSAGQVGTELRRRSERRGISLDARLRKELNVADADAVRAALDESVPDVLINTAAYTAVDKAETEREAAFAVNQDAPGILADACAERDIALVHVSTDYVFDGTKTGAYREVDQVHPLGAYGGSKEAGEQRIRDALDRHGIVRTSWVYAAHGVNFVRTMLRVGAERDELRVVADQSGTPTAAADIADALLVVASSIVGDEDVPWGTFHFTARGQTTWHGFAEAIFEIAEPVIGRKPNVKPITTSEYPTPAARPANSVLDSSKIDQAFGPERRNWREALAEVLDELLKDKKGICVKGESD